MQEVTTDLRGIRSKLAESGYSRQPISLPARNRDARTGTLYTFAFHSGAVVKPGNAIMDLVPENDRLALQPGCSNAPAVATYRISEPGEGLGNRRVSVGPVKPGAGEEPHAAALDPGMHAVAVELDLVQPSLAVGCRPHQRGQRRGMKAERCGGVWSSFVTRRASRSADSVHPLLNSGSDVRDAGCPARKRRLGTIPNEASLGLHDSLPVSARDRALPTQPVLTSRA
jgi:hypothetical protein